MGLIGFVIGPLFTDIPGRVLADRELRACAASLARHDPQAPRNDHVRAELRLCARLEAHQGQGRCPRLRPILPQAERGLRRRADSGRRRLREFAEQARAREVRSAIAFLASYGMAEGDAGDKLRPAHGPVVRTDIIDARTLETKVKQSRRHSTPSSGSEKGKRRQREPRAHQLRPRVSRSRDRHRGRSRRQQRLGDRHVGEIVTRGPSVCERLLQRGRADCGRVQAYQRLSGHLAAHRRPRLSRRTARSSSADAPRTSSSSAVATSTRATSNGPSASCPAFVAATWWRSAVAVRLRAESRPKTAQAKISSSCVPKPLEVGSAANAD